MPFKELKRERYVLCEVVIMGSGYKLQLIATLNQQYYIDKFFLSLMLPKKGIAQQICADRSCQCAIVSSKEGDLYKGELFLVSGPPGHAVGKHPQSSTYHPSKNRVRKSLKPTKIDKQNLLNNSSSHDVKQQYTCYSSNYFIDKKSLESRHNGTEQIFSQRPSLMTLPSYECNSNNISNLTTKPQHVDVRNVSATEQTNIFKKKPLQIRFTTNYSENKTQVKLVTDLKPNIKLDRAQSFQNISIPKLNLPTGPKRGGEWRSQYVNVELEKSTSKLTHRLTDLNVRCTESINGQESLRISEVVSESQSSRSDSHRTVTFPKRIKDLLHMKYSKMQGKKY